VKAEWETKPLGDVCTLQRGFDLPTQNRKEGAFPLVSSSGVIDAHIEGPVSPPGVVTGRSGSIGNVFYIEEDFWPLNTTLYVRDFWGNDPRFVFHLLNSIDLKSYAGGTGVPTLNRNDVHQVFVKVPTDKKEQHRIVTLLDEAFADIATAKANAEKNLQNARELFESHLDEVLGSQASDHIATTLGTEVDLVAGFAFSSSRYSNNENDIRLLRGDNIMQGYLRWEDVKRWPMSDRAAHGKFALKEGDVVLAMDRPWVKAGLKRAQMTATDLPCLQVQRTARLRTKQNLSADFLFHLTGSQAFSRHLLDVQTGIGVPHISGAQIQDFKFMRPPLAKQAMIATELQKLQEETQRLETIYRQKLTAFDDLKKSLLHQAFSGQL
jgi:type I restriction enzyme S subunit